MKNSIFKNLYVRNSNVCTFFRLCSCEISFRVFSKRMFCLLFLSDVTNWVQYYVLGDYCVVFNVVRKSIYDLGFSRSALTKLLTSCYLDQLCLCGL